MRTILCLTLLLASPVAAAVTPVHDGLDGQIARLDEQLQARPDDALLLTRRGELHRLHGDLAAAWVDALQAGRQQPALPELALLRSRLERDSGQLDAALAELDRLLDERPRHVDALRLNAEIVQRREKPDEAARAWQRFLSAVEQPTPDEVLTCARTWQRAGSPEQALAILDEGLARLGPVVSLQLLAIEIEATGGRYETALTRLDAILTQSARQERWLAQRGDLLAAAGRTTEAQAAWSLALEAIDRLGNRHRATPAVLALRAHLLAQRRAHELPTVTTESGEREPSDEHSAPESLMSHDRMTRWAACLAVLAALAVDAAAQQTLVPLGADWTYLDDGSDQGTAWSATGFDDSLWNSGPAQLGYGDGDEATVVDFGQSTNDKHITTYFRHGFDVSDPSLFEALHLRLMADDGAVVHLNGSEVTRSNLPAGTITSTTTASSAVSGATESLLELFTLDPSLLASGPNVLAVEIHQSSSSSSDISFDLELIGGPLLIVTRGPYLQLGTSTSMTVRWRTSLATDGRVWYGTSPGALNQSADDTAIAPGHSATLDGLLPDTTYYYAVGTSSALLAGDATYRFTTAPTIGTVQPVRVWVLGDSGTANHNAAAVRDAYEGFAGDTSADVWLLLGDNAYDEGTFDEYQAALFDTYPEQLRQSALWPARGNHDTKTTVYFGQFVLPTGGEAGGLPSGSEAYYSFDHGNVHFICLDSFESNLSVGGAMWTWLQCDLAATDQEWIVAYWHHPPYSKGSHDSDSESRLIDMRQNMVPLLEDAGVDLVLNGHSHSYERSYLIDGHYGSSSSFGPEHQLDAGDGTPGSGGAYAKLAGPHEGAVYCVAGCSGKLSDGPLDHPAMVHSVKTFGSVVIDVDGSIMDVTFLDSAGQVEDGFRIEHSAPVAWINLGQGLAGTLGVPVLGAASTLVPGASLQLLVCAGPSNAATTLVVGLTELGASFKGGVMVPHPDLLVAGLATDSGGTLQLDATWPPGVPSGASLYLQAWLADAGAPAGLAATNGVLGSTP